ncbi:MAG: Mrp/NBP35 family ATP-binding protein [Gammaproteobacteria bacterium]|nr:Mrp/NBP35 family ATP-binding protein [Gammaproteobacteria bacterium]
MSQEDLKRSIAEALRTVTHPGTGTDVVASGHVGELEVDDDGRVRFSFNLKGEVPDGLVRAARTAVEAVEGVSRVRVNLQLPQPAADPRRAAGRRRRPEPGSIPPPTPDPGVLADVSHVIAVSSGKGGVGKSMVATNLAVALASEGLGVGLLDADIYGPNIPRMFGESRRPRVTGSKGSEMIEPLEAHGVRLMSLGFLLEEEQPAIMRGPLISGILRQFITQVNWGPLDVMVVDMPPGTGDAQLSLVQTIDVEGAVMVTTPQAVSVGDVRRGVKMFERVNTRVLGIAENMSGLVCPHCGEMVDVFGRGGGERLAREMGLPFLGSIPLDPAVRSGGDGGTPIVVSAPESPAGSALSNLAGEILRSVRIPLAEEA